MNKKMTGMLIFAFVALIFFSIMLFSNNSEDCGSFIRHEETSEYTVEIVGTYYLRETLTMTIMLTPKGNPVGKFIIVGNYRFNKLHRILNYEDFIDEGSYRIISYESGRWRRKPCVNEQSAHYRMKDGEFEYSVNTLKKVIEELELEKLYGPIETDRYNKPLVVSVYFLIQKPRKSLTFLS